MANSEETARVALDLYYANRGKKPVKAVIYTHSHVDHYGGVRGVVSEDDVNSGNSKIYAPEGFLEAAVAENVMAGTAIELHVRQSPQARPQGPSGRQSRHHNFCRHGDPCSANQHHQGNGAERENRRSNLRIPHGPPTKV